MRYVFDTKKSRRYRFPTYFNDLVLDRAESTVSEVFVVIIEPGKASHFHKHDDMEQIFYVVEGNGVLTVGERKRKYMIKPAHIVRIPPGTLHSVGPKGRNPIKYICIDCFLSPDKRKEPTWESHVKVICKEQGFRFEGVAGSGKRKPHKK